MAEIDFNVLEAADAKSFNIYSEQEADVVTSATLTITSPNTDDVAKAITITGDDLTAFNGDGLKILFSSTGFEGNSSRFEDGVYGFKLVADNTDEGEITEGFAAIITWSVMTDSLGYSINMSKAEKDYHNERVRLLNNLSYSASVGAVEAFEENLQVLQRME